MIYKAMNTINITEKMFTIKQALALIEVAQLMEEAKAQVKFEQKAVYGR